MKEGSGRTPQDFLPIEIRLRAVRRAWRARECAAAWLRGLTLWGGPVLLALVADNLFHLPGWLRLAFGLLLGLLGLHLMVVRPARACFRTLTDEMVAAHAERGNAGFQNRVINAVLLRKAEFDSPLTEKMAGAQLREAADAVHAIATVPSDRQKLLKWGAAAGTLCVAGVLYAVVFHLEFTNALSRYLAPTRYIAPVTSTRLRVSPGDAEILQGDPLLVEVAVEGALPENATIETESASGGMQRMEMTFEGGGFSFRFPKVSDEFGYRISAGDAVSDRFNVSVRSRPAITETLTTCAYPEYMRLPPRTEARPPAVLVAPIGARIRMEVLADRPISEAVLVLQPQASAGGEGAPEQRISMRWLDTGRVFGEFDVRNSVQYRILLKDNNGVPNLPIVRRVNATPDETPAARILEPGEEITAAPDARITVLAEARDDFALHRMALRVEKAGDSTWGVLREWPRESVRELREGAVLNLQEYGLVPGDVVTYYAQGYDDCPGRDELAGRSRVGRIRIVAPDTARREAESAKEAFRLLVQRLIERQRAALGATRDFVGWVSDGDTDDDAAADAERLKRCDGLASDQESIASEAISGARRYADTERQGAERLLVIAENEMALALRQLGALRPLKNASTIETVGAMATVTQERVVVLLSGLIAASENVTADSNVARESVPETATQEATESARRLAEKMLQEARQFQDEQREIIRLSNQLAEAAGNDFTEDQEKTLEQIVAAESQWANYFQEKATDLSKLPPQDFSLSGLAKEYVEIYSEVQKAGETAAKAVEIAVPLEQSGFELAESIEANLERWLMETPDRVQWTMEDPVQDYDMPLAELPDELEDIIGDLMEEQDELMEEAEDATSAWLASLDKGAGWTAMDGPIANMSAKGVTGNMLPNNQEIGGRSGEGRTGKSSGQFVEETATGKGGRDTPTRLTVDPFEAGTVKDTSQEPGTGSTGGGKSSGVGQEGLHGPLPPTVQQELKRVASLQQQLIDKAERLDYGLRKFNYPRGELPTTIELMKQIERDIGSADIPTARAAQKIVLTNLREVKDVVTRQKQVNRVNSVPLSKEIREEVAAASREDVPEEYQKLVEGYFRALSEAGQ